MSLQFNMIALLLVVLILLGILSHNSSITISAAVLLIMQQTLLAKYIPYLEKYGLRLLPGEVKRSIPAWVLLSTRLTVPNSRMLRSDSQV